MWLLWLVVDGATPLRSLQDGIEPMWEDERNKRGGRWLITLNKQQRRMDLDRFWLETVGYPDALAKPHKVDGSDPSGGVSHCCFCSAVCCRFIGGLRASIFTPVSATVVCSHVRL